jgi:hypothetical protein
MVVRCRQCGANNNSGNLLCLTCGAELLASPEPLTVRPMPAQPATPPPLSGSSIVRPTAEPTNSASYPFQGEASASPVGRYLVLGLLGLTVAVAGWQWRFLPTLASRFLKSPATSQSKVTNPVPASVSISPAKELTPQSAQPEPSELASEGGPGAAEETPSRDASQEGSIAAVRSKAQVQSVSASTRGHNRSESEGNKYLNEDGMPANCDRAPKELVAAAEHSSAKAQSALGTMYATGHCVIRDLPLAYRWFARAQRQNPRNRIIEEDMRVLWDQMSPEERNLAQP